MLPSSPTVLAAGQFRKADQEIRHALDQAERCGAEADGRELQRKDRRTHFMANVRTECGQNDGE
jgi:hypothetical protein